MKGKERGQLRIDRGEITTLGDMLEEMVVRILSRLPPKSLVRFKCVGKLWHTIINDPSFVAKNLSISKHNKFASATCILVRHTLPKDRSNMDEEEIAALNKTFQHHDTINLQLSLLHICNDDDGDGDDLTFDIEDPNVLIPSSIIPASLDMAGHCDGIVCLYNRFDVVLCNPVIREFKLLPESSVLYDLPPKAEYEDEHTSSDTEAMGFGFDSKAKEYKVVRVVETYSGYGAHEHPTRAEVYTMGANSWRELENVDLEDYGFWSPCYMDYKGTFHWWISTADMHEQLILTFDMSDEQFHQIPMPECLDHNDGLNKSLAVLKESLVLLTYEIDDVPKYFNMWMMDESTGVKGSWTKYFAFGPVEGIKFPLVFWNSEELLMVNNGSRLVTYNLGTKKIHHFPIQGVQRPENMQAIKYVNSIISVKKTAS